MTEPTPKIEKGAASPPLNLHANMKANEAQLAQTTLALDRLTGIVESFVLNSSKDSQSLSTSSKSRSLRDSSKLNAYMQKTNPTFDSILKPGQSMTEKKQEYEEFVQKLHLHFLMLEELEGESISSSLKPIVILSFLSGEAWSIAHQTYSRLALHSKEITIDELLSDLGAIYGEDDTENVVENLLNTKQENTSVEAYYMKFMKSFRSFRKSNKASRDLATSFFVAGLNASLMKKVKLEITLRGGMKDISTEDADSALQKCLSLAKTLEAAESSSSAKPDTRQSWRDRNAQSEGNRNMLHNSNGWTSRPPTKTNQSAASKPLTPEEVVTFFSSKHKLSLAETKRLLDNKLCLKCKKGGHSARNCPSRSAAVTLNMFQGLSNDDESDQDDSKN